MQSMWNSVVRDNTDPWLLVGLIKQMIDNFLLFWEACSLLKLKVFFCFVAGTNGKKSIWRLKIVIETDVKT